jgi:hypothetical protein
MNKRNLGIALIVGGLGYTAYRVSLASKANLALDAWFKDTYATSGAIPSALAVAVGLYLIKH